MTSPMPSAPSRRHHLQRALLCTLLCALACSQAHSAVSCAVNNAVLAFGTYTAFTAQPTDSVGTVDLSCANLDSTAGSGVSVLLGIGASANGSATQRKLAGNGSTLNYGIYSDPARTRSWTEGPDAPQQPTGPLQARETRQLRFTLYGRIPPLQNSNAGAYSDSLVITVTP